MVLAPNSLISSKRSATPLAVRPVKVKPAPNARMMQLSCWKVSVSARTTSKCSTEMDSVYFVKYQAVQSAKKVSHHSVRIVLKEHLK